MTDLGNVLKSAERQFDRDVEMKRKRSLARHELLQEVGVLLAELSQCSQQEFSSIYADQVDEVRSWCGTRKCLIRSARSWSLAGCYLVYSDVLPGSSRVHSSPSA